jgi:asparagine synthase (glutamine-hydrolysing)
MCGIAGLLNIHTTRPIEESVLSAMNDTIVHRGPDGDGLWISTDRQVGLAHRRLAIIDLSPAAAQPMANENGRVLITFNGEIWNHRPLRQELQAAGHRFRTDHSDTEVLIHGYEEWGETGLLNRIHGMFAFAIWDADKRQLFVARDRIGIKPVYFAMAGGTFLFGSEIKALLRHPAMSRNINPAAMYHYLSFLTTPAPMTMFAGVDKLPAGCYLTIAADGRFAAHRWWDALPGRGVAAEAVEGLSPDALEDFYVRGVQQRLRAAVEKRMMSDVPFGVFLSGGIDSSTNLALMDELMDQPVNSFTVGFKEHEYLNEIEEARFVANHFGAKHHEVLIDEQDMIGYLDKLVFHQDEPIADWVCIPLYFVSRLAKDSGCTVIQVGEGADEQFCGYASYMGYLELWRRYWQPFRMLPGPARHVVAGFADMASRVRPTFGFYADIVLRAANDQEMFWSGAMSFWENRKRSVVNRDAIHGETSSLLFGSALYPESYNSPDTFNVIRSFAQELDSKAPGCDVLTRMIYNEFKLRLPELLLMRVDKITMSTSIESRVPFLDHELVEFTMDIPMHAKVRNWERKHILKKAVRGLLPDRVIDRPKMGFGAPMREWLRSDFGRRVQSELTASPLMARGFFDVKQIDRMVSEHRSGRVDNSLHIWTLYNLACWYDQWVDRRLAA